MKKSVKKILKIILLTLLIAVFVAGSYVAFVFLRYYRIEDNTKLTIDKNSNVTTGNVKTGKEYSVMTYNIGFAAYLPSYSFFMEGGEHARAYSKESVIDTTNSLAKFIKNQDMDFALIEEVDLKGTRTYHVNEYEMLRDVLDDYESVYSSNYHSEYLMAPLDEPIGANESGVVLFSKYGIESSVRRSLPISDGFSKIFDLDRCYSVSRIPVDNGRDLVIYTLHLSAYGADEFIMANQIKMLTDDMRMEYKNGNYVIAGGDFNQDLVRDNSMNNDSVPSWAWAINHDYFGDGINIATDILPEKVRSELTNSCRESGIAYDESVSFTSMLDGFAVSDNVDLIRYEVLDTDYELSDHEPVIMTFKLKE